ncbi:MFS transporter [Candidatus Pacearchaeota archaeon]|nr:MFS transporter [Candidatus Pacearchaeota archaeon]
MDNNHNKATILATELTDEEKEKTRKYSIKEGSAASVMSGAGESYITPYALELQANNAQIGFLTSLTGFLGPISQIYGSRLIEKYSRRKIVVTSVILQASMWLVILSLGFIFLKYGKTFYLIPLLILSYILYAMSGSLGGPAWFSLLGDVVPEGIRGWYFSKRNRINGAVSITATLIASVWLYYTKQWGILIFGFMALFAIAAISRYISAYFLSKHYVAEIKLEKEYYFSFWQFLKKAPHNNFGKFTIFIVLTNLSINIAGPFFAVYMWKDLQFNPIWFTLVNASATIFSILFIPMWGKFADKYGNRELIKIAGIIVAIIPFFWLFSKNPIYLMLTPQLLSGIGHSALGLASSNFIYDAVTPQRRAIVVAYYNVLNGTGVLIGATLGGLIAQYASISFMNIFLFIFLISGIGRLIVFMIMMPKIKEVRKAATPAKKNPLLYIRDIKISEINPINILYRKLKGKDKTQQQ